MTNSAGRLATLSYFPGVARPVEARESEHEAARSRAAESALDAESVGTAANPRIAESAGGEDGWFVDSAEASGRENERAAAPRHAPAAAPASGTRSAPLPARELALQGEQPPGRPRVPERDPEPESRAELEARAEHISMSALARKGVSSNEMADRLRSGDIDEDTVQFEIARLERVALLDDRELASTLVRTLQDRKGLGRSGIAAELRRRKIDQAAIEEALDELDGSDELLRASEIAVKRASQLKSFDSATARRRLTAFLIRRGYSGSIVSAAVAAALEPARGPRFE